MTYWLWKASYTWGTEPKSLMYVPTQFWDNPYYIKKSRFDA